MMDGNRCKVGTGLFGGFMGQRREQVCKDVTLNFFQTRPIRDTKKMTQVGPGVLPFFTPMSSRQTHTTHINMYYEIGMQLQLK
jgi:hypothetical protein